MPRPRPEPVQVIKQRRDAALARMAAAVPYARTSASSSTGAATS